MTFAPDYSRAVVWPAHPSNYGYGAAHNYPVAFFIHTPEEPADPHGGTPLYFAGPNRGASTHYFAPHAGGMYQMVPESEGAFANAWQPGADGKVRGYTVREVCSDFTPGTNLNLQSLSVEVEGYAATINKTMPVGSPQWLSLVDLIQERCTFHRIPLDRDHILGHYQVSILRTCPGDLPLEELVLDCQERRGDVIFLAVAEARARLVRLANEDRWQELSDTLDYIGVNSCK